MRILVQALAFSALVVGVIAAAVALLREEPAPTLVIEDLDRPTTQSTPTLRTELTRGGVYGGVVVDPKGAPVQGASVLLVAWDTGEEVLARQPRAPEEFDPALLAVVGFRTAAEAKTDETGRFRVAADADSAIRLVVAYHPGHAPAISGVEGPQSDIRVVLERAGAFLGTVVDGATGEPVVGANVAVYLQQPALPAPETIGERAATEGVRRDVSFFAVAQRWVAQELGPRVWGVEWRGDETLRMFTDRYGRFRIGPLTDEVQLEFVIHHPEYMWTEFDRREEGGVRRTVVPPGETVERTFRLEKGKSIEGKVVDEQGEGVPDVVVKIEHVSQYVQHWWYRHKVRTTRTSSNGGFRVGGLSWGPYLATLEHPSFGRETVPQVPEGARNLVWTVRSRGAVLGRVEGLDEQGFAPKVLLVLEALDEVPAQSRHQRIRPVLRPDGSFVARGLRPGRWRTWVQARGMSSQPQEIAIEPLETTTVDYVLGGGGRIVLTVWDAAGRIVDPAMVRLLRLDEATGAEEALGRLVTREGRLDAAGVVPGRYVAEVRAPGYLPARSEPFDVAEEGTSDAGQVTLRQPGTLRIVGILGPDGRPARVAVRLTLQEGEDPPRPLPMLGQSEVPVQPGLVTLRAAGDDGSAFETTIEVEDGESLPVTIRLRR